MRSHPATLRVWDESFYTSTLLLSTFSPNCKTPNCSTVYSWGCWLLPALELVYLRTWVGVSRLPAPVSPFVSPHSSPSIGGCVRRCLPLSPFASRHLCLPFVVHFSPFFRICLPVGYKCRSSICHPFVPSYRPTVPLAFDCNSVLACLLIVAWLWRGLAWVGMGGVWLLCICRRVCLSLYCNLLPRILALIPLFPHLSSCVSCFCLSLYSPLDVFVTHCIWVLPWCHFPHCLLGCEHSFGVCVAFRWPPVSHATAWYRLAKHGKHSSAPLKSTLAKQLAEARNEI